MSDHTENLSEVDVGAAALGLIRLLDDRIDVSVWDFVPNYDPDEGAVVEYGESVLRAIANAALDRELANKCLQAATEGFAEQLSEITAVAEGHRKRADALEEANRPVEVIDLEDVYEDDDDTYGDEVPPDLDALKAENAALRTERDDLLIAAESAYGHLLSAGTLGVGADVAKVRRLSAEKVLGDVIQRLEVV